MDVLVKKTTDDVKSVNTVNLLYCISDHLSSRKDCKGQTYRVAIGVRDDKQYISENWPETWNIHQCIFFQTPVQVFPSRHDRKAWDKQPIIQHVVIDHFPDIFAGAANGCQCQIHTGKLVEGIYEYRASLNTKNRRWFRIK